MPTKLELAALILAGKSELECHMLAANTRGPRRNATSFSRPEYAQMLANRHTKAELGGWAMALTDNRSHLAEYPDYPGLRSRRLAAHMQSQHAGTLAAQLKANGYSLEALSQTWLRDVHAVAHDRPTAEPAFRDAPAFP